MTGHTARFRLMCVVALFAVIATSAQTCPTPIGQLSDIPSVCPEMSMTMLRDRMDRPYMYVANKEAGLKVYDVSDPSAPVFINVLDTSVFGGLHVMSVTQYLDFLYVALGNHFTNPQQAGVAIIDVSSPTFPSVKSLYVVPGSHSGASMALERDGYVYLCAMQSGLVILDARFDHELHVVSQLMPDVNYPTANPDTAKYNVRGIDVVGNVAFVAFDAGGVRVVDVATKEQPREVGRYSNTLLNGKPRAYNNIVVNGKTAYVTADYCGLEVLNLNDVVHISMMGWWNPYNCVGANWFASPIHTNELRLDTTCKKVFVSGGRTDVVVVDVSDPTSPDSCAAFGVADDDIASWGIDVYQNQIMYSYVCALIPFTSFKTGVRILEYTPCTISSVEGAFAELSRHTDVCATHVRIFNVMGEEVAESPLPTGLYYVVTCCDSDCNGGTIHTPSRPPRAAPKRGALIMHVNGVDDVSYNLKYGP